MPARTDSNLDPKNQLKLSASVRGHLAELLATTGTHAQTMRPKAYGPEERLKRVTRLLEIHRALSEPNDEQWLWLPKAVKAMRDESLIASRWKDEHDPKKLRQHYFDMINLARRSINNLLTRAS